jgi:L-alanine-DL-glutamate epimerase-like enolase superfamily enzyme
MKIIKAHYWTEHIQLTRPYTIAYKTIESVENIFVQLTTDTGLTGIGVASPSYQVIGETFDDTRAALHQHLEVLTLHQNIQAFGALIRKTNEMLSQTPAACAAVDIALYDLFCKSIQLPIAQFLGQYHKALPTSITIGIKSIEESIEEAKEYLDRGFKIIKLKIGKSLEEDVEVLNKIYEVVKGKMLIRVDANQGYTVNDLIKFVHQTQHIGVELIEQPFQVADDPQLLKVPTDIRRILAADESLVNTKDAFKLAHPPLHYGIYNIKLMKCGGIYAGRQIADIAQHAGIELMWGCNDESCVSIAAGLHAAFASPNTKYIDLDGSLDLGKDPFSGGFIIENGIMRLSNGNGLGLQ